MISVDALKFWQSFLTRHSITSAPKLHAVLGSGFGSALTHLSTEKWEQIAVLPFGQIPGFHAATVPDHAGAYQFYRNKHSQSVICFQLGRLHGYEGHLPQDVISTVMLSRFAGTQNFLLTNAAGGLGAAYKPGDIMMIQDHVNLTGQNPLTGKNPTAPDGKEIGQRFPDMSTLYNRAMLAALKAKLSNENLTVHEGIYLGVAGPSFETPAEVRLFQNWGMGAVGMSTVWEAIALGHSGANIAGLSLISNLGAGLTVGEQLDHHKILETSRASAAQVARGIVAWVETL